MDPFILREKFPVKRGSDYSSAALSTSILPGQGLEEVGKGLGKIGKQVNEIAMKRHETKMSLKATENALDMSNELTKAYDEFLFKNKKNPQTGQFPEHRLENGEIGSFDDVWRQMATAIRKKYITGSASQDTPFLEKSAVPYQQSIAAATVTSIQLDRNKMIDSMRRIVTLKLNKITLDLDKYLDPITSGLVDMERMTRNHQVEASSVLEELDKIELLPSARAAMEESSLEQVAEAFVMGFLRRKMWESADKFIEEGMAKTFGRGKDDTLFFLSHDKHELLQNRIHKIQAEVPGGLPSQISHYSRAAYVLARSGKILQAQKNLDTAIKLIEQNHIGSDRKFFLDRLDAEFKVSADYFTLNEDLTQAPFADHLAMMDEFNAKHIDGLGGAAVQDLMPSLRAEHAKLLKSMNRSGQDYVLKHDPTVLAAAVKANNEKDPTKKPGLLKKAIKLSLDTQRHLLPGNKPDILSIGQIESFNTTFNQKYSVAKMMSLDALYAYTTDFFAVYGDYAGQVLNELKNPEEGRTEGESITKLKAELAVAAIYPKRVFAGILQATTAASTLMDTSSQPWGTLEINSVKDSMKKESEKFWKSMGYAKFKDFEKSTMMRIATLYTLFLARQRGVEDPTELVDEAVKDIFEDKWHFHKNKVGGVLNLINTDIKYLSIPKTDSEGNAFPFLETGRAIKHVIENPSILKLEEKFQDAAHGTILMKDAGVAINSGDGTGFHFGYVDNSLQGKGRITLITDVIPWADFNPDSNPAAFDYPPSSTEQAKGVVNKAVKVAKGATVKLDATHNVLIQVPEGSDVEISRDDPSQNVIVDDFGNRTLHSVDPVMNFVKNTLSKAHAHIIELELEGLKNAQVTLKKLNASMKKLIKMTGLDNIWIWENVLKPFISPDPMGAATKFQKQKQKQKQNNLSGATYQEGIQSEIIEQQGHYREFHKKMQKLIELLSGQTDFTRGIEFAESGHEKDRKLQAMIRSDKGAVGPMQLLEGHLGQNLGYGAGTVTQRHFDDPLANIEIGSKYAKGLKTSFSDKVKKGEFKGQGPLTDSDTAALASYNWGVGNVEKFLAGVPGYRNKKGKWVDTSKVPSATQKYIDKVKNVKDYESYIEANAKLIIRDMSEKHINFLNQHGIKALSEGKFKYPITMSTNVIKGYIARIRKMKMEKRITIEDLKKFNRLIANQLGNLGLGEVY